MKLTVVQSDISTVVADAVVHPTNANLDFLGEVGLALSKKGGKALLDEVRELANCKGALPSCDGECAVMGVKRREYLLMAKVSFFCLISQVKSQYMYIYTHNLR